jgi:hypothetical protein
MVDRHHRRQPYRPCVAAIRQVWPDVQRLGVATWARAMWIQTRAAIRQVMAEAAPDRTERPGVATRPRGDGGADRDRRGHRGLAAIRQVLAAVVRLHWLRRRAVVSRLAAIRQVLAAVVRLHWLRRRAVVSRLAAIRQVQPHRTARPGVATWAWGDAGVIVATVSVSRLAAVRQGRPTTPTGPGVATRSTHGPRITCIPVSIGVAWPVLQCSECSFKSGRGFAKEGLRARQERWSRMVGFVK